MMGEDTRKFGLTLDMLCCKADGLHLGVDVDADGDERVVGRVEEKVVEVVGAGNEFKYSSVTKLEGVPPPAAATAATADASLSI